MKKLRKKIAALLSVCLMFSAIPYSAFAESDENVITVLANGVQIEFDVNPITENDRTLVPMRAIFETLGAEVEWDNDTQTAVASLGGDTLSITIDSSVLYKNGTEIELDAPARMVGDRTLVPVRAVAESFNAKVDWDEDTQTVSIATAPIEETPIEGINSFAFNMNNKMDKNENYMFSPMSIKMAMAMAANGSSGETLAEIVDTLGIDDIDEYNKLAKETIERTRAEGEFDYDAYNALIEKINSGEDTDEEYEQYIKMEKELNEYESSPLRIANSIWINRDREKELGCTPKFKPEFENIVREYYDGESKVVGNNDAVEKINDWVSEKTAGKIPSIIDNPNFLAALVNAVYFKGKWLYEFNEYSTKPDTFTNADGTEVQTDFMNLYEEYIDYYSDSKVQGVRLPYTSDMSMYIFTDDGSIKNYEPYLDNMNRTYLNVSIPKFKIEYMKTLNNILKDMGIDKAFSEEIAEFYDICTDDINVYIDKVLHKTYINVDEKGTEAAAVTAITMDATITAIIETPEPIEFKADSPFTFIIRDNISGEIIFIGRVANLK